MMNMTEKLPLAEELDISVIRDMFDGVMTKPVEQIGDNTVKAIMRKLNRKLSLREGVTSVLDELRKDYPDSLVYLYKLGKYTAVNHNFYTYEQSYIRVGVSR